MANTGIYIYGIIPNGITRKGISFNEISNGVYTIPYRDISAVASVSEKIDWANISKEALARLLLKHQRVLEDIMPEHRVIPMKLATLAEDDGDVERILAKGYKLIKEIFEKITNIIEIDIAVTWSDFNSVIKEAAEIESIREFKKKLLANPKGVAVSDQIKIGHMIKRALTEKRENLAFQIENAIRAVGVDSKRHELMDDKMITNIAFLINRDNLKILYSKIEKLNTEFAEKLNFRCVGPLPPYSFYTLELKKLRFEETNWAKIKLGLSNVASKEEIKKAHQTKAFLCHPDKSPDIAQADGEFDEINKAYNLLLDYCKAYEQVTQKETYSFNEEDLKKNTILVKLKD